MSKVLIFVEGLADQVFLNDLLSYHFEINFDKEIVGRAIVYNSELISIQATEGWTKLNQQTNIDYFIENKNGVNLLIFDADESKTTREGEIKQLLNDRGVTNFEIFLFSNKHGEGDLETLLIEILEPERKAAFFNCFNPLEECLNKIDGFGELTTPNRKAKVFSFASTFLPKSNKQQKKAIESNRNYQDKNLWDLDNMALNPLVEFLKAHLQ